MLLVQPIFEPIGGGEVVAAWALEALKATCEVGVLSWNPVDTAGLNRYFGTALCAGDFRQLGPSRWLRRLVDPVVALGADPWCVQRYAALMRTARGLRADYDVALTTFNEADLGPPAIQYIHQPWCHRVYAGAQAPRSIAGRLRRWSFPLRPWRLLAGFSFDRMRANLTLVNSDWTGRWVGHCYGVPTETLYPPVPGPFVPRPWREREPGFVCLGRLIPFKQIERAIEIVERVRAGGESVRLHIVGRTQLEAQSYLETLRRSVARRPWVMLHEDLGRGELMELLSRQRFGLHTTSEEPFGIAVAELARSGCVVFNPAGGGQVEIGGGDPALIYRDPADAAQKILTLLRSPERCARARAQQQQEARRFGRREFEARLRAIVSAWPRPLLTPEARSCA